MTRRAGQPNGIRLYVDVIFRNMWSEPRKLDEVDVVATVLLENGFDAAQFLALAQSAEVKQDLIRNAEDSVARGTFGSLTFFVGDKMFFGKNQVRDAEEEFLRRSMA